MTTAISSPLAMLGGAPVCQGNWPRWPQTGPKTISALERVLQSGRWAVSGTYANMPTADQEFATRFAAFVGARWCIPVDHGSNALVAALIAVGVKPGDEVIVPGLTWVACASSVLRVGAVPVLCDIDPDTLCIDPQRVEAAITPRTAAIMVVHLYSAMADMDRLLDISRRHHLPIIEDAAQAHGARWDRAAAGSLGAVGTFSMQQGKVLTAGEGGAVVTSRMEMYEAIEQLRGDGRRYSGAPPQPGRPDLTEVGLVQGWNMHLSEMQATLLLDGLDRLDEQNRRRQQAAAQLDAFLSGMEGLEIISPYPGNTQRTFYHYVVRIEPDAFAGRPVEVICEALSAELGTWVHPSYRPLNNHPLYQPQHYSYAVSSATAKRLDPSQFELPQTERQVEKIVALHHPMLLAEANQIALIVEAFAKVQRLADVLPVGGIR